MVTNAEAEERPTSNLGATTDAALRTLVAGSPIGAVRRILLYAILAVILTLLPPALAGLGLVCVLLLATTDVLR